MGFLIKKFISQFLMPVPLVFELFLFGWLLTRFCRHKSIGRFVKGLSVFVFMLFSYGVGSEKYLYRLERRYRPVESDAESHESLRGTSIVILGQGFPEKSDLPLRYQAGASFQQRLQEGSRLYRKIPDARLIVSLAGDAALSRKEQFIDQYALEHDLKRANIHLITSARDTSDEARLATALVKTNRLMIVTSASHMPRAVNIFSKELARRRLPVTVESANALSVSDRDGRLAIMLIPAPCDYVCPTRPEDHFKLRWWALPLPSVDGIVRTQHALYEWLGNLHEDLSD